MADEGLANIEKQLNSSTSGAIKKQGFNFKEKNVIRIPANQNYKGKLGGSVKKQPQNQSFSNLSQTRDN